MTDRADRKRRLLEPEAKDALEELKYEVAEELGLRDDIENRGWENMTTRETGKIGGHMVRRLVRRAEKDLARRQPLRRK